MELTTNSKGHRCLTTFSGSMQGEFELGARLSDEDILNRVNALIRRYPHDENIYETAMDLLDELLG